MLTASNKTSKSQKQVFILCRYLFKTNGKLNGTVCSLVRNEEGKEHKVWTHTNGCASSCDCEGFEKSHGRRKCYHLKEVETIEAAHKAELLEQVNAELAKVGATPATAEEIAATQARSLLPNNVDQLAYFIRLNRRSTEYAKQQQAPVTIVPLKTPPVVRKVSQDWLLGHRGGTFSGRAEEVA